MMLLTKEVKKNLPALYSQETVKDPDCVLKFFTPDAQWTWYITEGRKEEELADDGKEEWVFFGKVISPMCPDGELGNVVLSELRSIRGALGLPIERDRFWNPKPLSQCK